MAHAKVKGENGWAVVDAGTLAAEFEAGFWENYPRRMAKKDALKAYIKARATATERDILAGVERYLQHKPSYADWKLPAGWLRDERWTDEYDVKPRRVAAPVVDLFVVNGHWSVGCKRLHGGTCANANEHYERVEKAGAA